jgi:hypothetical protein
LHPIVKRDNLSPMTYELITHSRLATLRACPRKHLIRYELGLRPSETSLALRVGTAFHAAIEADAKQEDPEAAIGDRMPDPYDMALVAAMFYGYKRRWADAPVETIAAEQAFEMPLVNPETGAPTPLFRLAGVIDRIVKLPDGRLALMESKTTSRDFSIGGDYWNRLHLDSQLSIYLIAARHAGYDIQTILYDVTKRPAQRPLKATPLDKRNYKKDGTLYANQRDRDESPEEYAARVAESIGPENYARIEIARLDQDLADTAADLWEQQLALRSMQKSRAWWRNPGACYDGTGFHCEYLAICQNRDLETVTPSGYTRSADRHPELTAHATLGASPAKEV